MKIHGSGYIDLEEVGLERLADMIAERVETKLAPKPLEAEGVIAVRRKRAAEMLGVSYDYLLEHVLPDCRIVRKGRMRLVPVEELEFWVTRNSSKALPDRRP